MEILQNSFVKEDEVSNFLQFVNRKTEKLKKIIKNTIFSINNYKKGEMFSNNDANICISRLNDLYIKIASDLEVIEPLTTISFDIHPHISKIQKWSDLLLKIISVYGTHSFDDLLNLFFGNDTSLYIPSDNILSEKYNLLSEYFHPIGYKVVPWQESRAYPDTTADSNPYCNNKQHDTKYHMETFPHLECFDYEETVPITNSEFWKKIYGMRVILHNKDAKKTIIITGVLDEVPTYIIECNRYIQERVVELRKHATFTDHMIDVLTLKQYLTCGQRDLKTWFFTIETNVSTNIKHKRIEKLIKEFYDMDILSQRTMILHLLLYDDADCEMKYIAYLLYDLLALSQEDSTDSSKQKMIYSSFSWKLQTLFKNAMRQTIQFNQDMMTRVITPTISLEQQIFLLRAPECVKQRAMAKLKEIKGKPDDNGSKAKQYLEGLLKIPFNIIRKESILTKVSAINTSFFKLRKEIEESWKPLSIPWTVKAKYTNREIQQSMSIVKTHVSSHLKTASLAKVETLKRNALQEILRAIESSYTNSMITKKPLSKEKNLGNHQKPNPINELIRQKKEVMVKYIQSWIEKSSTDQEYDLFVYQTILENSTYAMMYKHISSIETMLAHVNQDIHNVMESLHDSIYGHNDAKNQVMKIIGQWMNGEPTGYCFGFEGSPGIGKTSLAKRGLAQCLKNADGSPRPFAFIALGGSCNGSFLEGHGYTYMNSTWGKICDILMETQCMNPIIYIDELDKVSNTDQGREIIGILMHLIDSTQNDNFQDKYFNGIPLNMSNALFVFSYNDPDKIDRILLDRIHRIKFDHLSTADKLVIAQKYILPEICEKMGFVNSVVMKEETIEYIIDQYTCESGVRKLKEIIFDIYGEINLEMLKTTESHGSNAEIEPIVYEITKEIIAQKYLKKQKKIVKTTVVDHASVGIMNGLWANHLGNGGILPIEAAYFPSATFLDLKLTGLQGDVMKESMNVAKTLAWQLLDDTTKHALIQRFDETRSQGLHIHCPDGAISKDGPSAGGAITVALYSLFTEKQIDPLMAMTGEIDLRGKITAIGGLDNKLIGGIAAGVKTFLFPRANLDEYNAFLEKHGNNDIIRSSGIQYIPVDTISEVLEIMFQK
jgi:ATP-dependent Lon protease